MPPSPDRMAEGYGDLFVPRYRPMARGDWELRIMAWGFAPGHDTPGYAEKVAAAARRWMRGRWLTGSPAPW